MTPKLPREFWVGISDTNIAHIRDKQVYASDYHVVEHSALTDALEAKEIFASHLREAQAEIERLKSEMELLGSVKLLDVKREQAFEKQSAIISVLAEALEQIANSNHGTHCDLLADDIAKDALEKYEKFKGEK